MKNLKEILSRNWLGFTVALIIFLLMGSCVYDLKDKLTRQTDNVTALQKDTSSYRLENGQLVKSVNTLQYDKDQLKELITNKDKKLKEITKRFSDIKYVTKYVTNTKFDTINIRYADSVPCVFDRVGELENEWYSMYYKSNQNGIEIKELYIPDSVSIVMGSKRKWFLGKETQTIDITHSNKFVNTEQIQHIEVVKEKSFINKYWIKEIAAFAFGFFLAK